MKKYRVEAFIIPVNGKTEFGVNQIDDVKLAKKLKDQSVTASEQESDVHTLVVENNLESRDKSFNKSANAHQSETCENHESVSEFSEAFFEINEHIYDEIVIPEKKKMIEIKSTKTETEYAKAVIKIEEPIYDEPFVGTLAILNKKNNDNNYDVPQVNWILGSSKYRRFGIVAPKLPKRSSSLKSITEDNENFDDTLPVELCCHGNKNGCLPSSKRPEDISEDIFKENWMQRLDALRKLETLLKDKEIALQSRERLLFKKEKELRILERLVKDKMKQTELYAKRHKKTSSSESIAQEQNTESKSLDNSQDFIKREMKPFFLMSRNHLETKSSEDKHENYSKNPPNSKSSLMAHELQQESKGASSRSRSRTLRTKRSDDLDSTLSADIGDSSFVITARKFDPGTLKRPTAFSRSASERRPKLEQGTVWPMLTSLTEKDEQNYLNKMEEKTCKKISQNILAVQDQATKFLNYGPIDENPTMRSSCSKELINQKRYSYLNLESTHKPMKFNLVSKQRPVSWSENTDDWLMKKRQAYNLATKKILHPHEKENFDGQTNANKSTKMLRKKKETSNNKFSIFR